MCDHCRVKCLDCGEEGSPASLLGRGKKKTMSPAAIAARKVNARGAGRKPATGATWGSLTKAERSHLREQGARTLQGFKVLAAEQAGWRAAGSLEPCWECRVIARKLGLPI